VQVKVGFGFSLRISGSQGRRDERATIKFQLYKVLCMDFAVGNMSMEEIAARLVNILVSLLKKNWQNVSPFKLSFPDFLIHYLH
jgi:hypothetical protein